MNLTNSLPKLDIRICGPKREFSSFKSASIEEIFDYFEDKTEAELDTETYGFDPHTKKINTLQLGDSNRQYVIDVRSIDILKFKSLIESKRWLLQNAKFDYKMLFKAGIVLNDVYDTMLTEQVIFNGYTSERGASLDALVKNYLGVEMEKETRGTFTSLAGDPLTDRQILYAGRDVAYLGLIKKLQQRYINMYDLQEAVDLENKALFAIADMELNGMYLDKKEWLALDKKTRKNLKALELEMDKYLLDKNLYQSVRFSSDLFGNPNRILEINYKSPIQMIKCLKKLGLDVSSTDDKTLNKLRSHEFVQKLRTHRVLSKKVSTYGESFLKAINSATGRVHTNYWQIQETFRLASGDKKNNLPNLQNIPASNAYRNCFKARDGYSWVSIDFSSQELRIMADKTGEQKFIDALNAGEDLHCFAYNTMTGESITKADKEKRTQAKTINFGKPYGMSPYKLMDQLECSLAKAEELFDLYAKAFPDLNKGLDALAKSGKQNGYILIDKRHKGRRWFPQIKQLNNVGWKEKKKLLGEITRASMNTPIQGTAAVQTKDAMIEVRNWLITNNHWNTNVYMLCQVHDELNFEIKDELLDTIVPNLKHIMVTSANKYLDLLDMEADVDITKKWTKT
jgi:DNA polymerase-1